MSRARPVVAIDGPAGAGKSTVSRRVAQLLHYTLLDTGALYRCVALRASREGASEDAAIGSVAARLAADDAIQFRSASQGPQAVLMSGEDVTQAIRTPEMSQGASKVSAIPSVRAALLDMQRAVGRNGGVVVEGRDIGSVVFPDAEAKFFLTASVEARAKRRHLELQQREGAPSLESVMQEVEERDRRDSNRPVAPLIQAADAVLVDSTGLSIDQVVDSIVERVRRVEQQLAASQ
ncbi:MAG TPA: (d)CMP kinase [Polyangiaceae bacterium]|nr:(d)CMP kinase [Polyangiaceae bacterium]